MTYTCDILSGGKEITRPRAESEYGTRTVRNPIVDLGLDHLNGFSVPPRRNVLITSALPYVNNTPHWRQGSSGLPATEQRTDDLDLPSHMSNREACKRYLDPEALPRCNRATL